MSSAMPHPLYRLERLRASETVNAAAMIKPHAPTTMPAIGNHEEQSGIPVNEIGAALILADKSDTHRSRVRRKNCNLNDIHDRVNYSVVDANLYINNEKDKISLELEIDTEISSVTDYFEIFLGRMIMCRKAADKLGLKFGLYINNQKMM